MDALNITKDKFISLLADAFRLAYGGECSLQYDISALSMGRFQNAVALSFTGSISGLFSLSLKKDDVPLFIQTLLRNFSIDVDARYDDVLNEFTNIYAAHLATAMAKDGLSIDIGTPGAMGIPSAMTDAFSFLLTTAEGIDVLIRISINARDAEYVRNH